MRDTNYDQYWQALKRLLETCDCQRHAADEPVPRGDWNERAVVYHDLYVAQRDEEVRWETCEAVQRALARLEEGTFGRCVGCGERISRTRLTAVPWAERCHECQAKRESQPLPRAA